ncbi:ABC transporter substrate-binding protein [Mycolicibacterium sp. S2-37]|uniref:ABC transporter substrate-binding protein n=1 Tax=Mycolicibacterium sp. S2-37 TaxID=2810297 RepID=UPI001A93F846|nr:ABC transporter substrate-binding protein [Mycolicibacterium sp. S2-37]MBO0678400.1 ABC transporter substrate-binding protein [Mycolicibacterium sp. S2-37]
MPSAWSRRSFLAMTAAAATSVAAGCAADEPGTVADDGSVTVTHVFGDTRIPDPPTRVVSAGFTEQDDLLAVGIVPIAVTDWFGGEPFGVWPWARPRLGPAQPAVLSLTDGIQVDAIAALRPDLIVATNAGLDADTYTRLSDIAPTVAQSGPDAFFEPWKDQATIIGQAAFKADEMSGLIAGVEKRFTTVATGHPQFAGKKAMLLRGNLVDGGAYATPTGWRTEFLTQMGFTVPEVAEFVPRDGLASALRGADVLIWTTESDAEQAALLADPVIAALPADRHVFTGKELAGAIAFASPLSYPFVADTLPPLLSRALR